MKHISLLLIIMTLLISCKKNNATIAIPKPEITGTFTFIFDGHSIDGYTKTCALLSNNTLFIGGNSNSDNSIESKYVFEAKVPMITISVGQYLATVNFKSLYAPSSYSYYATNEPKYKMVFNIVSYNATTKAISCSFNGALKYDFDSTINTVTNGTITGVVK